MTTDTKKTGKIAIIRTGSKQYVVTEGSTIKIEKLSADDVKDGKVKFADVLLVAEGDKVQVGTPTLKATVSGEVVAEGRDKKVTVIHYRAKSRHFKKAGHRQPFMKVKINTIS